MMKKEVKTEEGKIKKRVFETTWSRTAVYLMDRLTFQEEQFFKIHDAQRSQSHTLREVMNPYAISYADLSPFAGKKTRVTIEVIP